MLNVFFLVVLTLYVLLQKWDLIFLLEPMKCSLILRNHFIWSFSRWRNMKESDGLCSTIDSWWSMLVDFALIHQLILWFMSHYKLFSYYLLDHLQRKKIVAYISFYFKRKISRMVEFILLVHVSSLIHTLSSILLSILWIALTTLCCIFLFITIYSFMFFWLP